MLAIEFLSQPIWQRLGLTLLHFLWQGLLVAILIGQLIQLFKLNHGTARYAAYLFAFLIMAACPVATFLMLGNRAQVDPIHSTSTIYQEPLVKKGHEVPTVKSTGHGPIPPNLVTRAHDKPNEDITHAEPPLTITGSPEKIPVVTALRHRFRNSLDAVLPWTIVVWLVGVIILSFRLLLGFVGVSRWRHRLEQLPDSLKQRIISLSGRLGMRGFSQVFASPFARLPMAVGYFRPIVLLPAAMLTQLPPEMLEAIIAHELAHIRRFDLWVNLIQRIVETLLFYHPVVWWLSNRLRNEREFCCDELAAKAAGNRRTYASALEYAGRAELAANRPVLVVSFGRHKMVILARVRQVLGISSLPKRSRYWLVGVLTLAAVITLGIVAQIAVTGSDAKLLTTSKPVEESIPAKAAIPAQNSFRGITVSIRAKKSVYEPGSIFEIVGTISTDREHTMYNAYWDLKKPVPGRLFVYDEAGNQILEFYDPRHHRGSSTGATKSACRKYKPGQIQQIFLRQYLAFGSADSPLPPGHYKVQLALNGLLLWEAQEYVAHREVPQDLDQQMVAYSNVVDIEIEGEPVFRGKTLTHWIEALRSSDISVRKHAVQAMWSIGPAPRSAVPALIEALRDESEEVRSGISHVLGEIGPEAASSVPSLIMALKDEYWVVRSEAARALGKIGDKRAVEPLITSLEDIDHMVRKSAAQSLGNLGDIRALEPLKAAAKDSDRELRKIAAWALEQVKPATQPQLEQHVWEQLVTMVSDADLVVVTIKEQHIDNRFEIKQILKGSGHVTFEQLEKIDGMDMPPADETKQWILFLRVERERGCRLYPLVPTGWFVPYSKGLAQKILEAIPLSTRWGLVEGGLRMGLRMRKPRVPLGGDILVEIHIQNVSQKNITLYQHLMPMYGYHPYMSFEVVTPDEKRWKLGRGLGKMSEYDFTPALELSPGETYIHTVRLNKWAIEREPLKPGEEFNLFTPGTYKITCTYSVGEKPDYIHPLRPAKNAWSGTLISSPVELQVIPAKDVIAATQPLSGSVMTEVIKYLQIDGRRREVSWTLRVVTIENYESKWFLRREDQEKEEHIGSNIAAMSELYDIKAAPNGRYLAVVSVGEGHPVLEVVELPLLLKQKKYKVLRTVDPYPGGVAIGRWDDDRLILNSSALLTHISENGRVHSSMALMPSQSYALSVESGKIEALSQDAKNPIEYFSGQLSVKYAGERDDAAMALVVLKAKSAIPALKKAIAAETNPAVRAGMQKAVDELGKLPAARPATQPVAGTASNMNRTAGLLAKAGGNDVVARRHAAADLAILLMKRNGIWREDPLNWKFLSEGDIRLEVERVGSSQGLDLALPNMCAHCMARLIVGTWRTQPIEKPNDLEASVIGLAKTTDDPAVKVILLVGLASSKSIAARDVVVAATADPQLGVRKSANYLVQHNTGKAFGPIGVIHIGSPASDVDAAGQKIRAVYKRDKTIGAGWGDLVGGLQTRLSAESAVANIGQAITITLEVRNISDKPIEVANVQGLARLLHVYDPGTRLSSSGSIEKSKTSYLLGPGQTRVAWSARLDKEFQVSISSVAGKYNLQWRDIHPAWCSEGTIPPNSNGLGLTLVAPPLGSRISIGEVVITQADEDAIKRLLKEFKKHTNSPKLAFMSMTDPFFDCDAYRNLLGYGWKAVPYVIEQAAQIEAVDAYIGSALIGDENVKTPEKVFEYNRKRKSEAADGLLAPFILEITLRELTSDEMKPKSRIDHGYNGVFAWIEWWQQNKNRFNFLLTDQPLVILPPKDEHSLIPQIKTDTKDGLLDIYAVHATYKQIIERAAEEMNIDVFIGEHEYLDVKTTMRMKSVTFEEVLCITGRTVSMEGFKYRKTEKGYWLGGKNSAKASKIVAGWGIMMGKTVFNVGDKIPVTIITWKIDQLVNPADSMFPHYGSFRVITNDGKIIRDYEPITNPQATMPPIKIGEERYEFQVFLDKYCQLPAGEYNVTFRYVNHETPSMAIELYDRPKLQHIEAATSDSPERLQISSLGPEHGGLQCRVLAPTEIEQGMLLKTTLELQAIPENLGPSVTRLNTFMHNAFLKLSLKSTKTKKVFTIQPYDPTSGMLAIDTGRNMVPLDGSPLEPWQVRFPLARERDALEPGLYECTVEYSFPKEQTQWWDRTKDWKSFGFWSGTVISGTFQLTILKETPKTKEFFIPKRLHYFEKDGKVNYTKQDAVKIEVPIRNGFFIHTFVYNNTTGALSCTGGVPIPDDINGIDNCVELAKNRKLSYTIKVVETSVPYRHLRPPGPGSPGYKVLWEQTFTVSRPESKKNYELTTRYLPPWLPTAKEHATLTGHKGELYALVVSPDGKTLASGDIYGTFKLWDTASGSELTTVAHDRYMSPYRAVAFSPDGKVLASTGFRDIALTDVATGKRIATFKEPSIVSSMAFSPDGTVLATGGSKVLLLDAVTLEELPGLKSDTEVVGRVAFSPDGKLLASADRTVQLWDMATKKEIASLQEDRWVSCMAFSPNGKMLATGTDRGVKLWDVGHRRSLAAFNGFSAESLAWSPDGKMLAVGEQNGTITLWHVPAAKPLAILEGHQWRISGLTFLPDGHTLVAASSREKNIKLWDLAGLLNGSPSGKDIRVTKSDKVKQLRLMVSVPQETAVDQPVDMLITLTNQGPEEIMLRRDNGSDNCTIQVFDSKKRACPLTPLGKQMMGRDGIDFFLYSRAPLEQGELHTWIDLVKYFQLKPGKYTISVAVELNLHTHPFKIAVEDVEFEIIPAYSALYESSPFVKDNRAAKGKKNNVNYF